MEWITKHINPIRNINTKEIKLSELEIQKCVIQGMKQAFALTSNPCITLIELEIFKAVKQACNKPRIQ